jgi:DNA-binding MarR family transcriptional regulator
MSKSFDFKHAPGHLIRRAHQVSIAIFMEETAEFEVTSIQFAILNVLIDTPGLDQVSLAARVALDAATSGAVIGRLESKGWVRREPDVNDRRRKRLWVTPEGEAAALKMKRVVSRVQSRLMSPLESTEQVQFLYLLDKLVAGHQNLHPD